MICYRITILTNPEDFSSARIIEVQHGTEIIGLPGNIVRSFIECTNKGYLTDPWEDVIGAGLELIPPPFRPVFRHLYEEMKDKI